MDGGQWGRLVYLQPGSSCVRGRAHTSMRVTIRIEYACNQQDIVNVDCVALLVYEAVEGRTMGEGRSRRRSVEEESRRRNVVSIRKGDVKGMSVHL